MDVCRSVYRVVSCSKSRFHINAKAKFKFLIAGFEWLHHNKIFNFTKMYYSKILLVCVWCELNKEELSGGLQVTSVEIVFLYQFKLKYQDVGQESSD